MPRSRHPPNSATQLRPRSRAGRRWWRRYGDNPAQTPATAWRHQRVNADSSSPSAAALRSNPAPASQPTAPCSTKATSIRKGLPARPRLTARCKFTVRTRTLRATHPSERRHGRFVLDGSVAASTAELREPRQGGPIPDFSEYRPARPSRRDGGAGDRRYRPATSSRPALQSTRAAAYRHTARRGLLRGAQNAPPNTFPWPHRRGSRPFPRP